MAEKLTPQQARAVHDRGGKLLVSAAAGSGKTKVLVDRLLTYLTDPADPADLDEFLIITYTKAAASELRAKIAAKLTERIALEPENRHLQKQMQRLFLTKISTVHGFCADILREYAYRLDLSGDFRVADENECREIRETVMADLLDRAYADLQKEPDFRAFVDTQGLGRDDRLVPQIIEKVYNSARCHLDPQGWLETCLRDAQVGEVSDVSETVWGKYLMEEFAQYLSIQLRAIRGCIADAEQSDGMEKVCLNLQTTLVQLEELAGCTTWDGIVKNRNVDFGRLSFPRKNVDLELCERIKAIRNGCKKGLEKKLSGFADPSAQVLADLQQSAAGVRGLVALVRQFDRDYSQTKKSRRCVDFGDLEHKTLDLLLGKSRSGPTAPSYEIGRRFREILVDEYQDSNGVQDAIFDALTREKQNCFMVGDVKQSIYQFRLADPGIFLNKYKTYAPAEEAEDHCGRKVLLSHNFRSGPEVIHGVNAVFETCMTPRVGGLYYTEAEALREGVPHEALPDPAIELYGIQVEEETYIEEAAFVADKIRTMLHDRVPIRRGNGLAAVEPDDIVILLRSPGSIGSYYQRALEARGIRVNSGGGTDLLQTQEVGTLRSFLQTIVNPRLDIPLISTLASPIFGFTADDLAAFRGKQRKGSVYDALLESDLPKAKAFLEVLQTLRREAGMATLSQLLERVFSLTRLDSIYGAMEGGDAKKANLQTFFQLAAEFETGALRSLGQFLEHLDALEEKGLAAPDAAVSGCVTIMSIHKSKGLEFPVVFLCGLSRGFNREDLRSQILCDKELGLGLSIADRENRLRYPSLAKRAIAAKMAAESLSEEMRVLYVAMTRARDRLIMTYASGNLQGDLQSAAMGADLSGGELFCREASCPGDWILLTAVKRTEAGEFFALGGKPADTGIGDYPWKIRVVEATAADTALAAVEETHPGMPPQAEEKLQKALSFRYAHTAATLAPSKQTATGRKGRVKDGEAAEHTREPKHIQRTWRRPGFLTDTLQGKDYGNAIHEALQYIRYENCGSLSAVEAEIARLAEQGFLKREQAEAVKCEKIAAFFATDVGRKLRSGSTCLREFKFSILDEGSKYGEGLEGEKVLLQGVVDCALLEPDGITIVDFKTDRVTQATAPDRSELYRPQLETYAEALSRIYELPVKQKLLYFFHLDRFVEL